MKLNISVRSALKWGIEELKRAGVYPVRSRAPQGARSTRSARAASNGAVLDAEVLLAYAVSPSPVLPDILSLRERNEVRGRAWLYAHSEEIVSPGALRRYKKLIARRVTREPVAYIVGHKEFYGVDFFVNHNVLIPRPETEGLVELTLREMQNAEFRMHNCVAVDVGTGSGAIAVAVAKQFGVASVMPKADPLRAEELTRRRSLSAATPVAFFATDISPAALNVARKNARRHGVLKQIKFLRGNLLQPLLSNRNDRAKLTTGMGCVFIAANLPYLPTSEWRAAMPEVRKWEPRGALDGGRDGLKCYRELFEQLDGFVHNPPQFSPHPAFGHPLPRGEGRVRVRGGEGALRTTILCEICPEQASPFKKMVRGYFPRAKVEVIKDLAGRNRVVVAKI